MVGRVSVSLEIDGAALRPQNLSGNPRNPLRRRPPGTQPAGKASRQQVPPGRASQSSISPAQNTPGMLLTINPSSSPSKRTPPALLIASSSGRVRTNVIGKA